VLVAFYAVEDPRHARIVTTLVSGTVLFAPAHLDVEVASALRGLCRTSSALRRAVSGALEHLARFPIRRVPLPPLLPRIWELRHNLTVYDAAYVAVAERVGAPLVTCDARMATASGPRCDFEVIS
jgi:predicted nucleic acid-binding protein